MIVILGLCFLLTDWLLFRARMGVGVGRGSLEMTFKVKGVEEFLENRSIFMDVIHGRHMCIVAKVKEGFETFLTDHYADDI